MESAEFREWLQRDPKGNTRKAYCSVCKKTFDVAAGGHSSVLAHHKGAKHERFVKASRPAVPMSAFLEKTGPSTSTVTHAATSSSTVSTRPSSAQPFSSTDTLKAEIIWTLKAVSSHYSYKSCEDNGKVFAAMFPDSQIAASYKCGERKSSYLSTFGIARHFFNELKDRVKSETSYVLLFDESLNDDLQQKQLDIHVRVWENNVVATNYLRSEFMGHAAAVDLHERLEPVILEFGHRKLLQLSMDGPNVNWKLYE